MNCPSCNKEMESGFLQSVGLICWLKTRTRFRHPERAKGSIRLKACQDFLEYPCVVAFRCSECKMIVLKE